MSKTRTSSPASTGGAGTFFEQHVAAYWLAQLLVKCIPPVLIDCTVAAVHLQTEHLGWETDDFLIECDCPSTGRRKLVGQVKRTFTVSAADENCRQAIHDFWSDFTNTSRFDSDRDRFVLITQRGTNTLLEHFGGLLDCARAARDASEFESRLGTKGFISETAVRYCGELRDIISGRENRTIGADDLWPFLRVVHVVSLDLHTSSRQTEAQIKTLLAYSIAAGAPFADAEASWNQLLSLASGGMSEARSFFRDDLPDVLKARHNSLGCGEQRVLRLAKDHSEFIVRGIRSNLGHGVHLARAALRQKVLGELDTSQVVLISGPAGSGKSVIGKDVIGLLSSDHFIFSFRAEEFAQPHLDSTLQTAIEANGAELGAILAGQGRAIVHIESIERLLERPTRDAFADLMTMIAQNRGIGVVLTCRDYSLEQVRASFLQSAPVSHVVVNVPPLDDVELKEVETELPVLAVPLKTMALRNLLRNPYLLDKALEITWSGDRPLPESERDFRTLFWRQIVRTDHRVAAGTARRREQCFQDIALRRARALSSYVPSNDIDPDALAGLVQDGLITSSTENPFLVATAHDVLEDWAILHWIEEQNLVAEGSFPVLAGAIGGNPAIRRSYRRWVSELIDRDPAAVERLFAAAVTDTSVSAQFRDDTLVAMLRSPSAPEFLSRHEARLLNDDKALLKRVVHLLRVACMVTPPWLAGTGNLEIGSSVPDGIAWEPVLEVVRRAVDTFKPDEELQLLGLIEDAVKGVSWWAPDIPGADDVAAIAHRLVERFDNHQSDKALKRVLRVIAKIPKAAPELFGALLRGSALAATDSRNHVSDEFQEIVFAGMESLPAARDLPGVVIEVAEDYLLAPEEGDGHDQYFGASTDIERHFGIRQERSHDSFPASGVRGPWSHLFRHHPAEALEFFIRVLNHSATSYSRPSAYRPLEPPREIELTFADGSTRRHWGNPRLWNLHRGLSVGPEVLKSILMALETGLLAYAEAYPSQVDSVLVDILRRSQSASLAAVVASVATAHPQLCGEALLVLLSARPYVQMDLARRASEPHAMALSGMFSGLQQPEHRFYEAERKKSDALSHRKLSLEDAVFRLQFGPLADRVHVILDRHKSGMRPLSEQDNEDRMWRLAIHRMDLRQTTLSDVIEDAEAETVSSSQDTESAPRRRSIRLDPTDPEPDVKAMMAKSATRSNSLNERLRLLNWANAIFRRTSSGSPDPDLWPEILNAAIASNFDDDDVEGIAAWRGGPSIVAAVCIRDHWDEMSDAQRDWSIERVCREVMAAADLWNGMDRLQRFELLPDRPCAWVVSQLPSKALSELQRVRVEQAFVAALTHPINEVRWHATWGIAQNVMPADRELAMRCVNALAMEATLLASARHTQKHLAYEKRTDVSESAANTVRSAFWEADAIPGTAYESLDVVEWFGADANAKILVIMESDTENPVVRAGFARAAETLVKWWDEGEYRRGRQPRRERNLESENAIADFLERFLMRTPYDAASKILEPIIGAIDRHPREVHWILQGLTSIEDSTPNTPHYWRLWQLFADGVTRAKWIPGLRREYSEGNEMLSVVFLTAWWKDSVRHWRSLEGHAHHVHELFESLPTSWIVFDNYVRFLYHIGERSLPEAFIRVANSLRVGTAQSLLMDSNTVFMLVVLLQRHVYAKPLELKCNRVVREAVLFILDSLVESGSAAAFRMRDDFVTPLAG